MNYETQTQSAGSKAAKSPAAPIAWMGGKSLLANWILDYFPDHRTYVEPYGGMANVLLKKQPCEIEVYNDLDFRLVNLFRVIRNPAELQVLQQMCELTPYSRKEFESLVQQEEPSDPVQRAYWFFVRCRQARGGLGSQALTPSAWATSKRARRQMPEPVSKYLSAVDGLPEVADRFRTVVVESLPALEIFKKYDADDSLFYCDPPYPHSTLANQKQPLYGCTMSDADHLEFLITIKALKAKVIVSGYSTPAYDRELSSWRKRERSTHVQFSNSGGSRSEALWMNF
ncbi:DNA adenine methylase [Neorhodopirellula lusitana]|uniref:DNA adenine methylase n=2 Tax=Neorhodopirellula lusitana TaxID=445327 RepID=A0ABY1PQX2_9BACT|nr:DNA adenine methylase [Neorhodopirellula lusitana]